MIVVMGMKFDTPKDACEYFDIDSVSVNQRLRRGWHINDAYTKPLKRSKEYEKNYVGITIKEMKGHIDFLRKRKITNKSNQISKIMSETAKQTYSILRMESILYVRFGKRADSSSCRSRY